jgi:hypothetical protein
MPVAEPIVDQREQLTAGGNLGDIDAAVRADAGPGGADGAAVDALHGLDRGAGRSEIRTSARRVAG